MKNLTVLLLLLAFLNSNAQKLELKDHWFIKSSSDVSMEDKEVTSEHFKTEGWYETKLPSTVLNTLVENGIYPDPRIGMNNFLIPDASDNFNKKLNLNQYSYLKDKRNPWNDPYWYRTEVVIPGSFANKQIWLQCNGINYRADVWVNGQLIADRNEVSGMFRRFKFNITRFIKSGEMNRIALKIYQVDHPGDPDPGTQFEVFGNTRGHATDIFKDETMKMSGGWDCAPVVRDRNMGIWQSVFLEATEGAVIENPYVTTILPLPDTSKADIRIQTELRNISDKVLTGVLTAKIELISDLEFPTYTKHLGGSMPAIIINKSVSLDAGSAKTFFLDPKEFHELSVSNPYLWYPNGYGKQYLHKLTLTLTVNGNESDRKQLVFGIRQVNTELKQIGDDYGLVFRINGKRIFCKGGWLQPDMLLNMSRERIFDEARLLANANVNIVGNEDAPSPPEDVLESYDKYGIMYWEVFFQCWRMYPGTETAGNPLDDELAVAEVEDIVKRYRNNPSVVAWFVANEVVVDKELYLTVRKSVKSLDTSRPFIPTTSYDWDVDLLTPYIKEDLPTGTYDDGAPDYNWNPPYYYFNKVEEVHLQMFRNELGVPSIPTYSSLLKFIPSSHPEIKTGLKNPIFPLDSIWAEHGAWDGPNYCFRAYDNAIRTLYGNPTTVKQYADNAQYINSDSYRAMFEAANHKMWDITSGVMLWKLNSCWPDVGWQMYDWFLNPNAAYFFAKKAMEPLHIQMNANDRKVLIINATHKKQPSLSLVAEIIDLNMNVIWKYENTVAVEADSYKEITKVPVKFNSTPIYFIKLTLKNEDGITVSENLYWQCLQHEDFSELTLLPKVDLKKTERITDAGDEWRIEIELKNTTGALSFFNRLNVCNNKGEEIHPVFWSDNYISLFPGEVKIITATLKKSSLNQMKPLICIE